jgi:hypothetical protein
MYEGGQGALRLCAPAVCLDAVAVVVVIVPTALQQSLLIAARAAQWIVMSVCPSVLGKQRQTHF